MPLADGADDRAPDARVQRRIVEDQARRVVLEERRRAVFGAELLFLVGAECFEVPIHRHDVFVAGQEPGAVRHVLDRLVVAQCAIIWVGIGVEVGRKPGQIEAGRELP